MRLRMQTRWLAVAGALAAGTAGAAGTASAQVVTLAAALTGAQEVRPGLAPVVTSASGFGTLTYNQALGTIAVTLRVAGLGSNTVPVPPPNGAPGHVHLGAPTANGAIVIPVTAAPVGATSFDVVQTYTFADLAALGITPANIATLTSTLNGLVGAAQGTQANLYFNVHTVTYPGGEIRGNLAVVPEPSTYALVAAGLGAVGVVARRRRRAARVG